MDNTLSDVANELSEIGKSDEDFSANMESDGNDADDRMMGLCVWLFRIKSPKFSFNKR